MRSDTDFPRLVLRDSEPPEVPQNGGSPESQEPPEVTLAIADYLQIRDYSLVLASQGIDHRIVHDSRGPFELRVEEPLADAAREQIALYKQENPLRTENPPLPFALSIQPLGILLVPVVFTLIQFSDRGSAFYHSGIADTDRILRGDWWRVFTALTLHGDALHLTSNLVAGFLILNLLALRIPLSRIALPLVAASGLANYGVALTMRTDFRSLGFSTFVFAALGALSTIEFRLMPRSTHGLLRRFAPLFGAASLAVFLGLGEHADILAHFYGFLAGLLCGFVPRKKQLLWGTQPRAFDAVLWALYFGAFAVIWKIAL